MFSALHAGRFRLPGAGSADMSFPMSGLSHETPSAAFEFMLNGRVVGVEDVAATTTLLDWLRNRGHTGSKCGCAEGDCGACTVALVDRDAAGQPTYRAINSCIALVPMFAGREVVTVEGLAAGDGNALTPKKLHPVRSEER